MANRYWVSGGTGNWNDISNWSATSGGASGASVPGTADIALLDAASGSGTVTLDISPSVLSMNNTGFTGTLAFDANTISLVGTGTQYTGSTTMSVTGTPLIILTNNSATARTITPGAVTEANSISFRITAGTGTLSITTGAVRDLDFTDGTNPTGYAGAAQNMIPTIYGNFKASTGMTKVAGTGTFTFAATSGIKTIDTAGVTFDNPFTFNGVGGAWSLQSALTSGSSRTLTLTNGVLSTNGYAVTVGLIASANSNARTLNLGASVVTLTGSGTAWNFATTTGLVFNAGTSSIVTTNTAGNVTFSGGGLTYYNVTFGATYRNCGLVGNNTFNNLTVDSPAVGRRALSVTATYITVLGTLSCSGAAANRRPRITGGALGVTFDVAAVSALIDVDFLGVTAAGASAPWSGTRLGDMGLNTNITFAASKTVYWNQPAGGNWSDVAWATSSGGTVDINNFPLGQDTAVLDNTGVGASSTIMLDYGWVLGRINAGALTNALTINWNCFANVGATSIGNMTLSSAITITYTSGTLAFATLSSSATITTAGVSFPIPSVNFNAAGKTFVLADNFTVVGSTGLVAGTLDLNGKTWTGTTFDLSFTDNEVHTIAFNGGQINVTGNAATVWACEDLTNFSYTGTPTVNLTYTGSTGTRQINNGSTAGGSEANAIDVNIVAGSDVIGTAGVVRNFTIQPAFTGSSGLYSLGFIYGNLALSASQTVSASANGTTFAATSGTKTITTNGVTIDRPVTFNGVGGTWAMQDALTLGSTRTLTMTNGTLQLKAATTNTAGGFVTLGENQKYLQSTIAGTQATLSVATGTISASHLSIKDIAATGGAVWQAYTTNANADVGNNTGWDFSQPSAKYIYTRRKLKRIIF